MRLYHYNKEQKYAGYIDTQDSLNIMTGYTSVKPPTEHKLSDYDYIWDGTVWNTIYNDTLLNVYKDMKIQELKAQWYSKEIESIEYNDNKYDYDQKSQTRIMSAITALTVEGKSAYLMWTTADNNSVKVKVSDLKSIISLGAQRSDMLHGLYNKYKEQIQNVTTQAELKELTFDWKEEE